MSIFTAKEDRPTSLNELIANVQTQMASYDANSEEFLVMSDQLDRLYKLKASNKHSRVSPDALVAVAGNLAGIGLILNYERLHVVTSKALGFVIKAKV